LLSRTSSFSFTPKPVPFNKVPAVLLTTVSLDTRRGDWDLTSVLFDAGLTKLQKLVLKGRHVLLSSDPDDVLHSIISRLTELQFPHDSRFWGHWGKSITSHSLKIARFHGQESFDARGSLPALDCKYLHTVCISQPVILCMCMLPH
jgi:hypothetical protein